MRSSTLLVTGLLAALGALCASAPSQALAGEYTVYSCTTPARGPAAPVNWQILTPVAAVNHVESKCPKGTWHLQMDAGKPHRADDSLMAKFIAPADTSIHNYQLWRAVRLSEHYNWRVLEVTPTGSYAVREQCLTASGCSQLGGPPAFSRANLVRMLSPGRESVRGLALLLSCARPDDSPDTCPAANPAAQAWVARTDITLSDNPAPVLGRPTGPLIDSGQTVAGVQQITVAATDKGSGLYQIALEVDGTVVSTDAFDPNGGLCQPPFTVAVPCKLSASRTIALNTSQLADGNHLLTVAVTDATGTNRGLSGPFAFRTSNGACSPTPRASSLKMSASVKRGKRSRRTVTLSYGKTRTIRGRLTTPAGAPVAGAKVCVSSRKDATGAGIDAAGELVTDARGRFAYTAPRGTSRRVYFVHRTPEGAVSASVRVRVRAPVRLRASRHLLRTGQRITFRGRLRGGSVPAKGVLIEMQARRTTGWQTFGTTHTNGRGTFHLRYRFSRTHGLQHYQFRAHVPRQPTYPFATGNSRRVHVRVSG